MLIEQRRQIQVWFPFFCRIPTRISYLSISMCRTASDLSKYQKYVLVFWPTVCALHKPTSFSYQSRHKRPYKMFICAHRSINVILFLSRCASLTERFTPSNQPFSLHYKIFSERIIQLVQFVEIYSYSIHPTSVAAAAFT